MPPDPTRGSYEVTIAPDAERSTDWRVEAIDDDGGIEVAIFSGWNARNRAVRYRVAEYGESDE